MSIDSMLDKFAAEAERLKQVIAASEKQLDEINNLMALYRKHAPRVIGGMESMDSVAGKAQLALQGMAGRQQTRKDQITTNCEEILSDGVRRFSRDLVKELAARGVEIGGQSDPATALASYLCREPHRFVTNRKAGGWTLKRFSEKQRAGNAPTLPALLSSNNSTGAEERPRAAG